MGVPGCLAELQPGGVASAFQITGRHIANSSVLFGVADHRGWLLAVNPAWTRQLGWTAEEPRGTGQGGAA